MNESDDTLLDSRLRAVAVPDGIAARVAPALLFDDVAIDRLLVRVDPPDGLASRAKGAIDALLRPAALAAAGDPGPDVTSGPGRRRHPVRPPFRGWRTPLAMLADLAAEGGSVAVALAAVGLLFVAGTELSSRLADPVERRPPANTPRPRAMPGAAAPGRESFARSTAPGEPSGADLSPAAAAASTDPESSVAIRGGPSGTDVPARAADPPEKSRAARRPLPQPAADVRGYPSALPGTTGDLAAAGTAGIRSVSLPSSGRVVPRVRGYDIAFEMTHGEAPFVDPSAVRSLAVDRPPLSLRTDSFDSLRERTLVDRGRPAAKPSRRAALPPVRAEEILAALPAETGARPAGGPTVSISAVRSLRASPGSLFVEIRGSAPPLDRPADGGRPLDVMLILDRSAGGLATASWSWICRGLDRVIGQMAPDDRLSVIVSGERPRLVALRGNRATLSALLPELLREPAVRSSDVDAAFRLATTVGRREGASQRLVAIAHADSLEQCRHEGRAAITAWRAERIDAAAEPRRPPTSFVLIDPDALPEAAGRSHAGTPGRGGEVDADPVEIGRAMLAAVFDRPTLACTGCRIDVAFDPARVGAYRLVGHRQTAAAALAARETGAVDLHAGEAARAVYEVVPRAGGRPSSTAFIAATLTSRLAASGQEHRVSAALTDVPPQHAGDPADLPGPHECELLLAVALGELAGGSAHADPWRKAAAPLAALAARWRTRGDVTPVGEALAASLADLGFLPRTASH